MIARLAVDLLGSPELRTPRGVRFLELRYLLTRWLKHALRYDPELAMAICLQFDNVLRNCDDITFDEAGAAEAYVILHFLDRYHRFQVTFDELVREGLMPKKPDGNVLDIGTGPGPSMFAVSDHYAQLRWRLRRPPFSREDPGLKIDYAEPSAAFRNWLHHFTELANGDAPSRVGWRVPYHHGSHSDFGAVQFDRHHTVHSYDDDGSQFVDTYIEKIRPDLIIMSNFLTTEAQVERFSDQIQNCARHLKHKGILLIVGARGSDRKYGAIYRGVDAAVTKGSYSRRAFVAKCERVNLQQSILSYDYADPWGRVLKSFLADAHRLLKNDLGQRMPKDIDKRLAEYGSREYRHNVSWELNVYRKSAIPRHVLTRRGATSGPNPVVGPSSAIT